MPTQSVLQRQLRSAQELQSIVRTMKALAAGNIHQYENAVQSLATFNRTLKQGLQIFLMHFPEALQQSYTAPQEGLGIVVFGSDQGMCGRFNEQMATYVGRHLRRSLSEADIGSEKRAENRRMIVVGTRLADLLAREGYVPDRRLAVPSALGHVSQQVQAIVLQLEQWRSEQSVDRIWTFYHHPQRGLSTPRLRQLFPFDPVMLRTLSETPWPSRCRPMIFQEKTPLFLALFRQFFFVGLYRACVESLASENASRLASMQMAEKNINERLEMLNRLYQQQRQTLITSELLDIVSGFEVLKGKADRS
ncbi:ATP synthase F1, gamma subunit [Synechococcus sp. PCC 7335]|uniref:F0F1 ATP synthase subunit gamma n=1 Tax=Synechococcus sp. (strain ATCC 29403 / PCC 7335) TaxID=91464 RepID=UPI00017ED9DA|nr:F0F1 ATP synthase subunit gamma [Synechococcus sp. PCC 7335]EDX83597.1 ATP synthase F1, gamma subunit [Synechococcus sp. PCC 7335]